MIYALVQTDKTKESFLEIKKEVNEYVYTRLAMDNELNKVKLNNTFSLAGTWETIGAVGGSLSEMIIYNLPENYFETYSHRIKNLSLDEIQSTAKDLLQPDNLLWVVVGDKEKIETGLRELGYDIMFLDSDGKLLDQVGMN